MKVAIFSDIHGNYRALEAVLSDIQEQSVDQIVCAGDIVNPLLRSLETWVKIKSLGIPVIRGNHEDYISTYFHSTSRPEIRESARFLPIQLVAQHLGPEVGREFGALPFDHIIEGPGGDELYICHASPQHNAKSYIQGVDSTMAASIEKIKANTIVAGHIHSQWLGKWKDKSLVIAGSVGLPLNGQPRPGYVIMAHENGKWCPHHRTVSYDHLAAVAEYHESGCVDRGGPYAWLLLDELWTALPRLAYFVPKMLERAGRPIDDREVLASAVRDYLIEIGRWEALKSYIHF